MRYLSCGRADHAYGKGREKRHLLERVLGDGGSDEPDDQHGQDDRGDETSVLHNGTLA